MIVSLAWRPFSSYQPQELLQLQHSSTCYAQAPTTRCTLVLCSRFEKVWPEGRLGVLLLEGSLGP